MKERVMIKKIIICLAALLILALLTVTLISALSGRPLKAADLKERKQESEGQVRVDYVDSSGRITLASDKGYATRLETRVDKEHSLITFLDEEGQTVVLSAGYDTIHRTYNSIGKADTDTYLLDGKPVKRNKGYYKYARSYNADGKLSEIRFLGSYFGWRK